MLEPSGVESLIWIIIVTLVHTIRQLFEKLVHDYSGETYIIFKFFEYTIFS